MLEIIKCEKCHQDVKVSFTKGFAHVTCEHCGCEYQLEHTCLKLYMLIPFISVAIAIMIRVLLIPTEDIFIKAVVILLGSYLIYFVLCLGLVKIKQFTYCKRIGG